ncbi:MAG: hypothetical protein AABZ33_11555 [Chloroflexota bacterium]
MQFPDDRESRFEPTSESGTDEVRFSASSVGGQGRRGGPLVTFIVAAAAVTVVGIGLFGPQSDGRPTVDLTGLLPRPSVTPTASPSPRLTPTPTPPPGTPLPALTVFESGGPTSLIPVMSGTRALLDPLSGEVRRLSGDFQAGLFVNDGAGGTLCICRGSPWLEGREVATMVAVRWSSDGTEVGRHTLVEYTASAAPDYLGAAMIVDAALTRDRSTAILATAALDGDMWTYRVEAFAVATGERLWAELLAERLAFELPVATPSPAPSAPANPTPRSEPGYVAPDGARMIAGVSVRLSPTDDIVALTVIDGVLGQEVVAEWHRSSWRIALENAGRGALTRVEDVLVLASTWCQGEGFATTDRYVSVCATWSPSGAMSTFVRLARPDGSLIRDIPISDASTGFGPPLVDADAGVLYLWDPEARTLARVDLRSGETNAATFGSGFGTGGGYGSGDPLPVLDRRTTWIGLQSALEWWVQTPLVGSSDGAYLYATSLDWDETSGPPSSTGIWVFDSATLDVVRIIPSAATHDSISMTADGRHLLATGIAGLDEMGRASDWGQSLSIFDALDGRLLERLGDLRSGDGLGVSLVWPPPSG